MGIAKYYSKNLLAITQILRGTEDLKCILDKWSVGVVFGRNATTPDGKHSIDLLIRVLARLYPKLCVYSPDVDLQSMVTGYQDLARKINSEIDFEKIGSVNLCVVVGDVSCKLSGMKYYIGADRFIAKVSSKESQTFSGSDNPFGAGAASCLVAAKIFQFVFKEYLPKISVEEHFQFSVLRRSCVDIAVNADLAEVKLKETAIVGIGAIGNGALWALTKVPKISGKIDLVDNQTLSLDNLQRYILFTENDVGSWKARVAAEMLRRDGLEVNAFTNSYSSYTDKRNNCNLENIVTALDNKEDRILAQSSLPRKIFNAYTDTNRIGISKHVYFGKQPCLACLYLSTKVERHYINEVADNCNIPQHSEMVKDYINLKIPVDVQSSRFQPAILDLIAQANKISRDKLNQFHGKTIKQFYQEYICAGVSLTLINDKKVKSKPIEAPLAFQSALAGIMLAAELVIDACELRTRDIAQICEIVPLEVYDEYNPRNYDQSLDATGHCLCADSDFLEQHQKKWYNSYDESPM